MRGNIQYETNKKLDYQIWRDPTTNIVMGTYGEPRHSFNDVGAFPLYDLNAHFATQQKIAKGDTNKDSLYKAFLDSELEQAALNIQHAVTSAGSQQKMAALRSSTNAAVDIVNVWTQIQGLRDRRFAGKGLGKEIPVNNLLISIDTGTKFSGLVRLDEGQTSPLKELTYTRETFTARKYGMKFVYHEEARLKNVHNVMQDSIRVAQTKIDQRASFDVLGQTSSLTSQAVIGAWDTFDSSTDHSTNDPKEDVGIAELNIAGSGEGSTLSKVGMHPLTYQKYRSNTNLRGVANTGPTKYDFAPGEYPLEGVTGITLVLDNAIQQGQAICVDTETENATIAYFQGPQRIGSAHDEETGDDKYFIIDYHLAAIKYANSGRLLTGAITPRLW